MIEDLSNSPLNIKTNSLSNPTDVTTNVPVLSAEYDNVNATDTASYYQVQVIADGGSWSSPLWDSGKTATNVAEGSRQEVTYGGTALLVNGIKYYQHWRFWNTAGVVGFWSDGTDHWTMYREIFNLTDWQYVKKITIDHTKVSTNLTDFPVLISTSSDSDLASHAHANGDDILFTTSSISWNTGTDSNRLNHEIERFSSSTGELVAWVKVPNLSATEDTIIYMYYGNSSSPNEQSTGSVWDTNYIMVQHLEENSLNGSIGEVTDSTSNNNDGVSSGSPVAGSTGKISKSVSFDGNNDFISFGSSDTINATTGIFTYELWAKISTSSRELLSLYEGSQRYQILTLLGAKIRFWAGDSSKYIDTSTDYVDDTWHYVVGTCAGPSQYAYLYIDGVRVGTTTAGSLFNNTNTLYAGVRRASLYFFQGSLDEIRASNIARSSNWITTSYNNQNNPNTFYSLGSEATRPSAPTIGRPTALSSSVIRWGLTDNASNETGFKLFDVSNNLTFTSTTADLSYVDETGLSENTQYTRYVKAYNSYGESSSSSATSTYTLADTPTSFNFIRHPLSVDIYVDAFPNSNSGLSGYLFWRTDNSAYNSGWIQTREWRDPNMVEYQTYTYAVKYRNGDGVETATTTMGGVVFIHDSGRGGGTPTATNNQELITNNQNTTSTASSTQATTTQSTTTTVATTTTFTIPNLAGLTGQARQVAIQQIKLQILAIQKQLIVLITQLIQALQAELANMLGR